MQAIIEILLLKRTLSNRILMRYILYTLNAVAHTLQHYTLIKHTQHFTNHVIILRSVTMCFLTGAY